MSFIIEFKSIFSKNLYSACLVIVMLMVTACGSDSKGTTTVPTPEKPVQSLWPLRDNTFAECMAIAARAAYSELKDVKSAICDSLLVDAFQHMPKYGTDVLRVFKRRVSAEQKEHLDVLVVFTGTRTPDVGDIARDVQSQVLVSYKNYFGSDRSDAVALSGDEKTGGGFDSRWKNHAQIVKNALQSIKDESTMLGQAPATTISVIGHSLGAATATRAAFDLDRSIQGQRIVLWSFNSPRIGNSAFANTYVKALRTCKSTDSGCLMIRQFTRKGDPIHELPLLMKHPIWNTSQEADKRKDTGEPAELTLDYCAHYHAPRASTLNLPQNHKLDRWRMDIYDIPPEHFNCMFKN